MKCGYLIGQYPTFNRHRTANPYGVRQSLCGRVGEQQIVCGDWIVYQTTSICSNSIACMAQILVRAFCAYVCSDETQTAILNWGPFWTPGRVRLPAEPAVCAFGNTLCGRSHGINLTPLVPMPRKPADDKRVALKHALVNKRRL